MTEHTSIKLRRTTAFRLSMTYAVVFCLLTIVALVVAYQHILGEVNKQIDAGLRAEAVSLAADWQTTNTDELVRKIQARSTHESIHHSNKADAGPRLYLLVGADGKLLAGSLPHWRQALSEQGDATLATLTLNTPPTLLYLVENQSVFSLRSHQTLLPGGARLLVAQALNELAELHSELLVLIGIVTLLMLGAGLLGGWWIGSRVVRNMENVIHAAGGIMAGDLSQRIPADKLSDEFALLAERLNLMLERIDSLMTDLHDVTENVAHDLRTPLTRLRAHAEVALTSTHESAARDALFTAIRESETLIKTLNAIMDISQVKAGNRQDWQRLNLTQVCHDVLDFYEPLAESKRIRLDTSSHTPPLFIAGNAQLLAQAIGNLLDNAIKYTPEDGSVSLRLEAIDRHATLTLIDTGPGIPAEFRDKVLQRFVRLDSSRSEPGNGLGLALVAAIVKQHNGELRLDDAGSGQQASGLKTTLILPLALGTS